MAAGEDERTEADKDLDWLIERLDAQDVISKRFSRIYSLLQERGRSPLDCCGVTGGKDKIGKSTVRGKKDDTTSR